MLRGIIAVSTNGCIGKDGALPWSLKTDLALFKAKTLNHSVVVGRATLETLPEEGLPGRYPMVISSRLRPISALREEIAMSAVADHLWLIGGAQTYALLEDLVDEWHITRVNVEVDGDTFFEPTLTDFELVSKDSYEVDDDNDHPFVVEVWKRKTAAQPFVPPSYDTNSGSTLNGNDHRTQEQ